MVFSTNKIEVNNLSEKYLYLKTRLLHFLNESEAIYIDRKKENLILFRKISRYFYHLNYFYNNISSKMLKNYFRKILIKLIKKS